MSIREKLSEFRRWLDGTNKGVNVKPGVYTQEEFEKALEEGSKEITTTADDILNASDTYTEGMSDQERAMWETDDELEAFEMDEDTYMEKRAFGNP